MKPNQLRALARLGRRTARREWKRTTLIAALVAVPVAAALVVAGVVRANDIPPEEQVASSYGTADVRIESTSGDGFERQADYLGWVRRTITELAPEAAVLTYRNQWSRQFGQVLDLDIEDPVAQGILEPWEGALPSSADEVALSPRLMRDLGVEVGDTLELGDRQGIVEVVGAVVDPIHFNREITLVTPDGFDLVARTGGTPYEASGRIWLVAGLDDGPAVAQQFQQEWEATSASFVPDPLVSPRPDELAAMPDELYAVLTRDQVDELVSAAQTRPEHEVVDLGWQMAGDGVHVPQPWAMSRAEELSHWSEGLSERLMTPGVVATLVAGVLLAEVALVAGAAYATGARRRLRELGLLGANGATVGHIRLAVLGEALAAGVFGALAGVALGVMALWLGRPLLQLLVSRYLTGLPITAGAILGPAVAGVLAVLVAAWLPARTAARVPTMTALQGRMPLASPPRWLVPVGIVLAAFGGLMTTVSLAAGGGEASAALAVIGIVTTIVGMALLTPPIIARVGRWADSLPATIRLVVRDSARQRTRAAAATAAAMVLLMAPVMVGFGTATDEAQQRVRGLQNPADHVLLAPADWMSGAPGGSYAGPSEPEEEYQAALDALRAELPAADEAALLVFSLAATPSTAPSPDSLGPEYANWAEGGLHPWEVSVGLATPEVVEVLGDTRVADAIEGGSPVLFGVRHRDTTVHVGDHTLEAVEFPIPVVWSFPRLLLPSDVAAELGLEPTHELAFFTGADPSDELWEVATGGQLAIGQSMISPTQTRWMGVGASLLVVLLILGLVTALSTTESDHDLRTMVAVGAPPRIRRRFLGLQTGYHALVGAVLAVPLAAGLFWAATRGHPWQQIGPFGARMSNELAVPWLVLLAVVVGVPLVIGALTSGVFRSAATVPPRRIG